MPLNPDIGPDLIFETNFWLGWKPLVANLETIATLVLGAKELVQRLSAGAKMDLESVNYLMVHLRAELDKRPEDWGTDRAFEKLGHAVADIDGLFGTLDDLTKKHDQMIPQLKTDCDLAIVAVAEKVQLDMLTKLQPIFQLFAVMLTAKNLPGNKYLAELLFLQTGLSKVQAVQATTSAATSWLAAGVTNPPRGVTWGIGSLNLTPPIVAAPPVTPIVAGPPVSMFVAGKLVSLEESIKNIEAQLVVEQVELGRVNFPLRAAAKAWLKIEAGAAMAYVFFLDPPSFMNDVGYSGVGNSAGQLGLQAAAAKAGFDLSEEALVVSSYKFELPTFLGKEIKDSQKLLVVPTADAWDSKDGFTGVRYKFRKLMHSMRKEQLGNANLYLTGDGLLVAKHMIQASFAFLETMESWILQQHNDLLGQGGTEKDCWEYYAIACP